MNNAEDMNYKLLVNDLIHPRILFFALVVMANSATYIAMPGAMKRHHLK